MTTRFIFIRHGSHDLLDRTLCGRMPGVLLSETGRREARQAAAALRALPVAAIYASPLERAGETAAIVGETVGRAPVVDEALLEVDVGLWTGETFDTLRSHPAWGPWNAARAQARPPGGESMLSVQLRVAEFMDRMSSRHPDQTLAAVSHGDVIKAAVCHALGLGLDHQHRIEIGPGSQTVLSHDPWGLRVLALNVGPT